jgi:hypothetical protein
VSVLDNPAPDQPPELTPAALAELLAATGLAPDALWVWLATPVIPSTPAPMRLRIVGNLPLHDESARWTWTPVLPSTALGSRTDDGAGYRFEFFGLVRRAQIRITEQQRFDFAPVPNIDTRGPWLELRHGEDEALRIQAWRSRAYYPGARLYAEQQWRPGLKTSVPLFGVLDVAHCDDRDRRLAQHGLALLRGLPHRLSVPRGRRRLRDNPQHPWRSVAEEAEALLRKNPQRHIEHLVWSLKVPGKSEAAKVRKLQRWMALLRETRDQSA